MSEQGAQMVLERWTEDESFRSQLRSDPEGAVRALGAEMDEAQIDYLKNVDWTLSDEELEALLTKYWAC